MFNLKNKNMEVDTKHGILKETLESLEQMGAKYYKCDGEKIFFIINKDSVLQKESKELQGVKNFMMNQFGYKLMVGYK